MKYTAMLITCARATMMTRKRRIMLPPPPDHFSPSPQLTGLASRGTTPAPPPDLTFPLVTPRWSPVTVTHTRKLAVTHSGGRQTCLRVSGLGFDGQVSPETGAATPPARLISHREIPHQRGEDCYHGVMLQKGDNCHNYHNCQYETA